MAASFIRMFRTRNFGGTVFVLYRSETGNSDEAQPVGWTILGSHQWNTKDLYAVKRHINSEHYLYVRDFFVPQKRS